MNGDDPAFPMVTGYEHSTEFGLTKREYFAAMAMQGLLSNLEGAEPNELIIADWAVNCADALLHRLEE